MAETQASEGPDVPPSPGRRVAGEAATAILVPFREAMDGGEPPPADPPALAMATVTVPAVMACAGQLVQGLAQGGLPVGLAFASAGALYGAVLGSLAILGLWAAEAVNDRLGKLAPADLDRAYRYALAFLAATSLPASGLSALAMLLLLGATAMSLLRRVPLPGDPARATRLLAPPVIGFGAFNLAVTLFVSSGTHKGILAIVSSVTGIGIGTS